MFLLFTRLLPPSLIIDLPAPNSQSVEVPLGGRNDQATIIVPASHRSPVIKLEKHIREHITGHVLDSLSANLRPRKITLALAETIDVAVKDTLSRLRVIRIRPRWKDLFLALSIVLHPPSLTIEPAKENTGRVDMLVVEGFADGFWPERWNTEDRLADKKSEGRIRGADDVGLKDVLRVLEGIRKELGVVVVLTLQALWVSFLEQTWLMVAIRQCLGDTPTSALPCTIQSRTRRSTESLAPQCSDHVHWTNRLTSTTGRYDPD